MSAIFYDYLTGEDREYAIECAEANNMISKGLAILEMAAIQAAEQERSIELKVLKESGTYDDYEFLLSEAQKEQEENKQGAISTIIEGFRKLVKSIINAVKNVFSKADPNAQVEVDKGLLQKADIIGKAKNVVSQIQEGADQNGILGAIDAVSKAIDFKSVAIGAGVTAITVAELNKHKDKVQEVLTGINDKIDSIVAKAGDKMPDWMKNLISKGQSIVNEKIKPVLDEMVEKVKSAGAVVKDKAGQAANAVKNGANNIKNAVTGGNNDQQQVDPNGGSSNLSLKTDQGQQQQSQTGLKLADPNAPQQQSQSQTGLRMANTNAQATPVGAVTTVTDPTTGQPKQVRDYTVNDGQNIRYRIDQNGLLTKYDSAGRLINDGIIPEAIRIKRDTIAQSHVLENTFDSIDMYEGLDDKFIVEFADDGTYVDIIDVHEYEISTEKSIYGDVQESTEDEESYEDLFNLL